VDQSLRPVADYSDADLLLHSAGPTSAIRYTARLRDVFRAAQEQKKVAVLHSTAQHVLSPMTSLAYELHGGFGSEYDLDSYPLWAVDDHASGRVFEGVTGRAAGSVQELRAPATRNAETVFPAEAQPQHAALRFGVHRIQRPDEDIPAGAVAEFLLPRLGAGAPQAWGSTEPLTEPWDLAAVHADTDRAPRSFEPFSVPATYLSDGHGSWGAITVQAGKAGVIEYTTGSIPLGPYPEDLTYATGVAVSACRALASACPSVTQTVLTLRDVDPGMFRSVRPHVPERALVRMQGPRAAPDFTFWADREHDNLEIVGEHPYQAGITALGGKVFA